MTLKTLKSNVKENLNTSKALLDFIIFGGH